MTSASVETTWIENEIENRQQTVLLIYLLYIYMWIHIYFIGNQTTLAYKSVQKSYKYFTYRIIALENIFVVWS